jgi:hypothetical protein
MFELKHTFKPEFLNRIDDIIVFHQLTKENIREITLNMLREVSNRLERLGINLTAGDEAVTLLADTGYDPLYGARPLRRAIQSCRYRAADSCWKQINMATRTKRGLDGKIGSMWEVINSHTCMLLNRRTHGASRGQVLKI